jgi:hypothetical protein
VGEIQFWVHPTVRNARNRLQVSVRRHGEGACVWRFAVRVRVSACVVVFRGRC